jgi:hypothetical protein
LALRLDGAPDIAASISGASSLIRAIASRGF